MPKPTKKPTAVTAIVKNLDHPVACRWWQRAVLTVGRSIYEASFLSDDDGLDEDSIQVSRLANDRKNGLANGMSISVAHGTPAHTAVIRALCEITFSSRDGKATFNTADRWEDPVDTTLRQAPKRRGVA